MKVGFVGLGKMGSQMVQRLLSDNHEVVVQDVSEEAVNAMVTKGAASSRDYADMIGQLGERPVVWLMIPQQFVSDEIDKLLEALPEDSVIIDGGNSDYRNTIQHGERAEEKGVHLIDVGTSGGVHGLENGFSMMVGGPDEAYQHIEPLIQSLAQTDGYGHFGKTGAGHFIKMVHNGVEYGVMQALAEGYQLMKEGPFEDVDLAGVAKAWQHGSINESFLNALVQGMLERDAELGSVDGSVAESGEARWTLETARKLNIPTPVIQAAFDVRLASQEGEVNYATKFLAQLRNEFGGHAVNPEDKK